MDVTRLKSLVNREQGSMYDAMVGVVKSLWTALPVIVEKDSDGHTMTARSAIKIVQTMPDGSTKSVPMDVFDSTPVHHPGGGRVAYTHPVKKGDEGLTLFTSRGHDNWHQKGGVQDPIDNRTHHLSDSWFIPGVRSDPRKFSPPVSSSSGQYRSDDGKHVSDLHPDNGITHSSTVKHMVNVGGEDGSGTLHLPEKILKNAKKVMINCVKAENMPPPGSSFANKKLIATKPVGAMDDPTKTVGSLMKQVMSGGIGSLLTNPTAAAGGSLTGAIAAAAGAVTGALGGGGAAGLVSALTGAGGLQDAVSALVAGAGALSGAAAPAAGAFGLSNVLAHAESLTQFFGDDPPAEVGLDRVLAPLNPAVISAAEAALGDLVRDVVAGITPPGQAIAVVNNLRVQLSSAVPASNAALAGLAAAVPAMTLAQAAANALISQNAHEAAVGGALGGGGLAQLAAAMDLLFEPSAGDAEAILAFPDLTADRPGAQGGFAA